MKAASMKLISALILMAVMSRTGIAPAGEIGFAENFALARDRAEVLKQLIPGTDEYFYYHCLDSQLRGDTAAVRSLLDQWRKQHHDTGLMREIQNRQALLEYGDNPQAALNLIRERLNLRFHHAKIEPDKVPDYPTVLDPKRVSWETLRDSRMSRHDGLRYIEPLGYERIIRGSLNPDNRRRLLGLLRRPDYPKLPELVVEDLRYRHSGGFGCHPVHGMMTLAQLDTCLALMPELLNNSRFIDTYLAKIRPSEDADPESRAARGEHLERLWAFVGRLAPAHNSLKACVLYRQLEFDREDGEYNRERFMDYLKLPRNIFYVNRKYLGREEFQRVQVNLGASYQTQTLLPPVGTDEELARDYLARFLLDAPNYDAFVEYIDEQYLKELFAETKIVNGVGDMQAWYNLLPADKYRRLKDRIDLAFLPANDRFVGRGEEINLQVAIKNIKKLIVNVYELNTVNVYRDQMAEITTAVDLDGLVPNVERTVEYPDEPLRRHVETLAFPEIKGDGVFVVELIGNGRSSRALIRRGAMNFHQRLGAAGHVFRIYDEAGTFLSKASIWMAGKEYPADEAGEIVVPYSNSPARQNIVIQHADFAVLREFEHQAETYALQVGFNVPRESLIAGETARVILRPVLTLNGIEIDRGLLLNPKVSIRSTDRDGIGASTEVGDLKLSDREEWIHEIKVPEKLAKLDLTFTAKVENLSQGNKIDLSASYSTSLNGIEASDKVSDLFLRRAAEGYRVDFLGRNGEPLADRAVHVSVKHRMITDEETIVLKTDAAGRVSLGYLPEITQVTASTDDGLIQSWPLHGDTHSQPSVIQVNVGSPVMIPFMAAPEADVFAPFSLLETRGGQNVKDWSAHVALEGGYLIARDLSAGDYTLLLKDSGDRVAIRVAEVLERETDDGVLVGKARLLELTNPVPAQIGAVSADKDALSLTLIGAGPAARVHIVCSRFAPRSPLHVANPVVNPPVWGQNLPPVVSHYLSGRTIGDEYRYVLERKYAETFPGNMLKRPSLLLAPWALRDTRTGIDRAKGGEGWLGNEDLHSTIMAGKYGGRAARRDDAGGPGSVAFTSYNFLPSPPVVLANLRAGKDGRLAVPLADLGAGAFVEIVLVDGRDMAYRTLLLPEMAETYQDLRLPRALPADQHLAERKKTTTLLKGTVFTIADMTTSKMELYDSLGKVFNLYATLSNDTTLAEFAFILQWPVLSADAKLEKYSEYACHELNVFLLRKDPDFFKQVIAPFIADKKDKTFMDLYLLDRDLSGFLEPWAYHRLNAVEKILLAERIVARRDATARLIKEVYDRIPPDIERFNRLFDTAVLGNALEGSALGDMFAAAADEVVIEEPEDFGGAGRPKRAMTERAMPAPAPAMETMALSETPPREVALEKSLMDGRRQAERKRDIAARQRVVQLFRKLEQTKEWVENNYYHIPIERQLADLVTVNAFWRDYAAREPGKPFLSGNLAEAGESFAEMMLALAVLDLPFKADEHDMKAEERGLKITPAGGAIAFHREIMPAVIDDNALPFLVSQNFFDPANRYRYENNEKIDRFIREEFVKGKVYGCQLVLTNPTSSRRKVNILQQVPLGAIPVNGSDFTRGHNRQLEPYSTQAMEYYFYFPAAGQFRHYPVHVAQNETLVGSAEPFVFNVVDKPTIIDTESWEYISQNGSLEEVVAFLNTHNLGRLDLGLVAFRMKDKGAFDTILDLLAKRLTYHDTLWSYAVYHNQPETIRQYLPHTPFADQCGRIFASPLLTVEPVPRHHYQHKEYWPLVNARACQLGERRKILNEQFHGQYEAFMKTLTYRAALTSADRMAVIVYLLLQDRVGEALEQFAKVKPDELETRMPYDYLAAYLSFYRAAPREGAAIAKRYADYPVKRWRDMFAAVTAQADEIAGADSRVVDSEDRDQVQTKIADSAPSLELSRDGDRFLLDHRNLDTVRVNYYPMDVELLFSRNPFVQDISGGFSIIRPRRTVEMKLKAGKDQTDFDVPEEFADRNVMIEVVGGGVVRRQAYYPNSLLVRMIPTHGQLAVARQGAGKPLPGVYVKVYARMKNGQIQFFKDGYTDLRGRFDYASLSTNEIDDVERFSILILSDEFGAVVREAAPPKM
ncbi:MAG: hypothetical protein RRC34_04360 [Lentisphaeria bacterium]|nr:hypothetical protein [Lentisphaeria bacterium]